MPSPSVDQLNAGPFLVLLCLTYMLFGVLMAQVYYYWLVYKDDSVFLRRYVWAISFLAACHSAFSIAMVYNYFITWFGDAGSGLANIVWSVRALTIVQLLCVVMTQGLYVSRIWHLSEKSYLVTAFPALLVLCRFSFGVANATFMIINDLWVGFTGEFKSRLSVNASFVVSVLADGVTSSLLLYYLAIRRRKITRTTNIVNKLMVYVVNTGAISIVFSLAVLFLFNLARDSLLFAGFYIMLGTLYANATLAMLNARRAILQPSMDAFLAKDGEAARRPKHTETHIRIYTETTVSSDAEVLNIARSVRTEQSYSDIKSESVDTEALS